MRAKQKGIGERAIGMDFIMFEVGIPPTLRPTQMSNNCFLVSGAVEGEKRQEAVPKPWACLFLSHRGGYDKRCHWFQMESPAVC